MEECEAWTGSESVHLVCELWLSTKVDISPSIGADFALVDAYSVNWKDMICAAPWGVVFIARDYIPLARSQRNLDVPLETPLVPARNDLFWPSNGGHYPSVAIPFCKDTLPALMWLGILEVLRDWTCFREMLQLGHAGLEPVLPTKRNPSPCFSAAVQECGENDSHNRPLLQYHRFLDAFVDAFWHCKKLV